MHEAVQAMMARYECRTAADYTNALREIMQEIALLGLWRGKFFEHAALYGGTALRLLHGLDRYSEDMVFSLVAADPDFRFDAYGAAVGRELRAFGFDVDVRMKSPGGDRGIRSAFLKADTCRGVLTITTEEETVAAIPRGSVLKIKLEVDTRPPGVPATGTRFLLHPIPFAVRVCTLPCLFAGKMHAVLCRAWRDRVKGRDWYDLVWYVARDVPLDLDHLRARMVQSGHLAAGEELTQELFAGLLAERIDSLDVDSARRDVERFVRDPRALEVWSPEFFREVASRVRFL